MHPFNNFEFMLGYGNAMQMLHAGEKIISIGPLITAPRPIKQLPYATSKLGYSIFPLIIVQYIYVVYVGNIVPLLLI